MFQNNPPVPFAQIYINHQSQNEVIPQHLGKETKAIPWAKPEKSRHNL